MVQLFPPTHLYPDGQPVVLWSVHVVAQVVAEAHNILFGQGPGLPETQVPLPLHWLAGVNVPCPVHDEVLHGVPSTWKRQAPTPSQVPSRPQVLGAAAVHSLSGLVPAFTGRHRPSLAPVFVAEQAWHVPVHALSQHTPSTQ
ncbi:MAG: hypothetical protein WCG85_20425 [Polyangia bacterium]